jgi:hypothetical protein
MTDANYIWMQVAGLIFLPYHWYLAKRIKLWNTPSHSPISLASFLGSTIFWLHGNGIYHFIQTKENDNDNVVFIYYYYYYY